MNNQKGATTLEAALSLLPFLLFVFGLVQLCIVCYTAFSLQYNLVSNLRESIVQAPVPGKSKYTQIKDSLINDLKLFNISTKNIQVNICNGVVQNCSLQESGQPNSFITVRVSVPTITIAGKTFNVSAETIAKNEPY